MPRGWKPNYKGRSRQFNSGEDIERQMKDDTWRRKKDIPSDEEDGDNEKGSDDESDEEGAKGTSGIEVENPNHVKNKLKKADDITATGAAGEAPELSRREREAIEKEQARQRYEKLHAEGKTDEARADLARLAIIRKQREEAAQKKQQEKDEKDTKEKEAEAARRKAMEAQLGDGSGKKKKGKKGR